MPDDVVSALQGVEGSARLADFIAGLMDISAEEKQALLETFDLKARLDKLLELLAHRIEVLKVSSEIAELDRAIAAAKMPDEVEKQARKELKRLGRMPEGAGEYSMIRTYLDWLIDLPWVADAEAAIDNAEARRILEQDHCGLDKIKKRILEYLAVRKLNPSGRNPILCFAGPPGVGKTSLGQSIAKATGRKFVRLSLGGVHDEAEIRGHRRTYIGSLPGNVIQSLRKAGTRNRKARARWHSETWRGRVTKKCAQSAPSLPGAAKKRVCIVARLANIRDIRGASRLAAIAFSARQRIREGKS